MKIKNVYVSKSEEPVYDIEVATKDHTFELYDNHRVSNCRLINDNDLFEMGSQVNSFGGAGLSLGSHRVVTINIRRVALESRTYAEFKELLKQRMEEASDILKAHKELIKDMVKKGTQPFISNGWINLDRMFSTFGIM